MLNFVIVFMIAAAVIYGFAVGGIEEVSNAVFQSGEEAVTLTLTLVGSMAIWGGIMRVAQASGLTDKISRLMMPILVRLFKGLDKNSRAMQAIAMNITANLFGLGNAATPLGIEAMKRLEQEEKTGETASKNMILFAVLNTSSVELIPATVATLRLAYGSREPMVILPCVLLVSLMSVAVCITLVNIFNRSEK